MQVEELQGRLREQTSSEDAFDVHDTYLHETDPRSPVSPTGADQGLSDQLSTQNSEKMTGATRNSLEGHKYKPMVLRVGYMVISNHWLNVSISRQKETILYSTPSIAANVNFDDVPMGMAMHLLELHWNQLRLMYLLTYRPMVKDSLFNNGPYVNKLLLNAIYLQSSLYSDRVSLRSDPAEPQTTGMAFYNRFKALLVHYVDKPSIPTVVALLTCGACLAQYGKQSASWMFCGMAYRMIMDLGYHLDNPKSSHDSEEDIRLSALGKEVRRRVYWGAYATDKAQSLYLGRPPGMHISDGNVPREFFDSYEELEEWKPYLYPQAPLYDGSVPSAVLVPLQHANQNCDEYIEAIQFFWFALLEYQRGCGHGLKRPLKLLESLMRRVEKVVQRVDIDGHVESSTAVAGWPGTNGE
ncbi:hypothetical protein SI65_05687 [Aspergillus cristatus]|uniref:Xylanolytic transcriptional activator regulatory domain-containing protein n=1 Tax=Aspergillus cristatus TaxID=573508 RepID=A0A1E3BDM2_ASPCR|nr:hypothetical protein SI65_05687 [Aspergillus cristatus]